MRDLHKCEYIVGHGTLNDPLSFFSSQVAREYPFNNLYLELGGDPEKEPTGDKHKVPNTALGA